MSSSTPTARLPLGTPDLRLGPLPTAPSSTGSSGNSTVTQITKPPGGGAGRQHGCAAEQPPQHGNEAARTPALQGIRGLCGHCRPALASLLTVALKGRGRVETLPALLPQARGGPAEGGEVEGLTAGSPCISENLVRASKRHGVTPVSHRLSGRKGSYFVRFSQPGRHSQAWSPSTPHARAKAPRPAGGARGPACPTGAGSGVQGEDKHRHVLQRAMLAQTCQAVLVTPSVPAGQRQGRQEGGQEAPCRP